MVEIEENEEAGKQNIQKNYPKWDVQFEKQRKTGV